MTIFRHVSTTNIDELSGGGDSCLYRSEESLPAAMRREEGQGDEGEQRYHHHHHSSNFMAGRAISCSDLLLDLNDGSKVQDSLIHCSMALVCLLQNSEGSYILTTCGKGSILLSFKMAVITPSISVM